MFLFHCSTCVLRWRSRKKALVFAPWPWLAIAHISKRAGMRNKFTVGNHIILIECLLNFYYWMAFRLEHNTGSHLSAISQEENKRNNLFWSLPLIKGALNMQHVSRNSWVIAKKLGKYKSYFVKRLIEV